MSFLTIHQHTTIPLKIKTCPPPHTLLLPIIISSKEKQIKNLIEKTSYKRQAKYLKRLY